MGLFLYLVLCLSFPVDPRDRKPSRSEQSKLIATVFPSQSASRNNFIIFVLQREG